MASCVMRSAAMVGNAVGAMSRTAACSAAVHRAAASPASGYWARSGASVAGWARWCSSISSSGVGGHRGSPGGSLGLHMTAGAAGGLQAGGQGQGQAQGKGQATAAAGGGGGGGKGKTGGKKGKRRTGGKKGPEDTLLRIWGFSARVTFADLQRFLDPVTVHPKQVVAYCGNHRWTGTWFVRVKPRDARIVASKHLERYGTREIHVREQALAQWGALYSKHAYTLRQNGVFVRGLHPATTPSMLKQFMADFELDPQYPPEVTRRPASGELVGFVKFKTREEALRAMRQTTLTYFAGLGDTRFVESYALV